MIKVEVPAHATRDTEWKIARLSPMRYYDPVAVKRESWEQPGSISYKLSTDLDKDGADTDITILRRQHLVAVTPLNLDLTARVKFEEFDKFLRS